MNINTAKSFLLAIGPGRSERRGVSGRPAAAADSDQVVVPQVDRRDIEVPKFPSNDFEMGLFSGTYATQNFGSSWVYGVKLGYHITEDFFVEGVYGQTKVSDELFRQILPGGVFPETREKLSYYNLSIGYNLLPGEIFIGGRHARPSQFYVDRRRRQHQVRRPEKAHLQRRLRLPRLPRRLGRAAARPARPHVLARPARQAPEHAERRADRRPQLLLLIREGRPHEHLVFRSPRRRRLAAGVVRVARGDRQQRRAGDRAGDGRARLHAAT